MAEEEEGYYQVKFLPPALEGFREAYPDLPPGDELILKMKPGICKVCGKDMSESGNEVGVMDVVEITEDGEVIGEHICLDCVEAGE